MSRNDLDVLIQRALCSRSRRREEKRYTDVRMRTEMMQIRSVYIWSCSEHPDAALNINISSLC